MSQGSLSSVKNQRVKSRCLRRVDLLLLQLCSSSIHSAESMSEQSAAFPGGYRGGACYQFGLGGPFNNRIVTGPAVVGSKRQRMVQISNLSNNICVYVIALIDWPC
jgi:hypothetical protein